MRRQKGFFLVKYGRDIHVSFRIDSFKTLKDVPKECKLFNNEAQICCKKLCFVALCPIANFLIV